MSDDQKILPRHFEKSLEYATVFADGAIPQFGSSTGRLIFYTKEIEPSEDSLILLSRIPKRLLKFEVRLPREALTVLGKLISFRSDERVRVQAQVKQAGEREDVIKAWNKLTDGLDAVLEDSENVNVSDIDYDELENYGFELFGRSNRTKRESGKK